MPAERISLADERNIFDSIGIRIASPEIIKSWSKGEVKNLKLLITALLSQRKMGFFVREFLVPQKIMSVIVANIKELNIRVSFVTAVALK